MSQVTSADGTRIAYQRQGAGPVVVLVGGGLDDGSENEPLAARLADRFTVVNYARRGRGQSGDTLPYAVEREVDDIAAVAAEVGGPVSLFGASSGGALALTATAALPVVRRTAVYEVPYCVDDAAAERAREFVDRLGPLLVDGRRDEALELFMWFAGSSPDDIAGARASGFWPALRALAPTLGYDTACMGDYRLHPDALAAVQRPVLVAVGGRTVDTRQGMAALPADFFDRAADALAAALPDAERLTLPAAGHVADPATLAPALERFFSAA